MGHSWWEFEKRVVYIVFILISDQTSWSGDGSDKNGNFSLSEVKTVDNPTQLSVNYTSGTFSCRYSIFATHIT